MKRLFYLSFMATLVIGCQEFVSEMSPVKKAESFEAVTEDFSAKTKTSMDESRNVVWSKGDYIAVFQACSIADKYYVTESSAGKTNGTFKLANDNSGNINGDFSSGTEIETNIAVYPFAEGLSCTKTETESSVTAYRIEGFTLPEVQYYSANSFGEEAFPMVAVTESSADHKLKFKNVCGAIKLQLKGTGIVQSITIQGKNGEKLSGPATITAYPGGTPPTIAMDENASTSVTLDCGNGVQLNEATATEFIISVPPVVFSKGFTFSVNGLETDVENIVYRSSILVMPEVDIEDRNIGEDLNTDVDFGEIVKEGTDKWNSARNSVKLEWIESDFHDEPNNYIFDSYAFNFSCPKNLTAYVMCADDTYFSRAGITKMEHIMIEIENYASRRYASSRVPIVNGEFAYEPDYYRDGEHSAGQLMNVNDFYVHGFPSMGLVTYFAEGSHGEGNCIYWENGQCAQYLHDLESIAKYNTLTPWEERAAVFGLTGEEASDWAQALLDAYYVYYKDAEPIIYENTGSAIKISMPFATGETEDGIIPDRVIVMLKDLQGNYYEPMYFEVPNYFH